MVKNNFHFHLTIKNVGLPESLCVWHVHLFTPFINHPKTPDIARSQTSPNPTGLSHLKFFGSGPPIGLTPIESLR